MRVLKCLGHRKRWIGLGHANGVRAVFGRTEGLNAFALNNAESNIIVNNKGGRRSFIHAVGVAVACAKIVIKVVSIQTNVWHVFGATRRKCR